MRMGFTYSGWLGILRIDRTWNGDTGQRTATCVQVIEQHTKCIRIKFNDTEFGLGQFGTIDLLCVRAHREPRHRQLVRLLTLFALFVFVCKKKKHTAKVVERRISLKYKYLGCGSNLLEQSCDEAHFFLSSACNCELCRLRIDRPHPAVMVPRRENARLTIGDDGTLFGRGDSMSGTWRKFELFGRWLLLCGDISVGAGRASNSATGTCGEPKPVWMPYSISYDYRWDDVQEKKVIEVDVTVQCEFYSNYTWKTRLRTPSMARTPMNRAFCFDCPTKNTTSNSCAFCRQEGSILRKTRVKSFASWS